MIIQLTLDISWCGKSHQEHDLSKLRQGKGQVVGEGVDSGFIQLTGLGEFGRFAGEVGGSVVGVIHTENPCKNLL